LLKINKLIPTKKIEEKTKFRAFALKKDCKMNKKRYFCDLKNYHLTRITRYLFFAVIPLLLPACVTMRHCPIETLQPARWTYEGSKNNIAICASQTLLSDAIRANTSATGVPADSLIANILFSLQRLWEEAPGYEDARFFIHLTPTNEQPETSNDDMVVWLKDLQIKNQYYGQQYSFYEWEVYLYVSYVAKWVVYSKSGTLIDEYTDRDLMIWPSSRYVSKSEAVENLPDVKDAWWDLGIALAKNYINRIAPQWQKEMRAIFLINKFPELSKQAYSAMQNEGYARAFDIWENMLLSCRKRGQKKTKSQITYNMAVACEFQNQLDDAIYWAQRSVNLNLKPKTAHYLNFLRERKQHQTKLDQQILKPMSDYPTSENLKI